MFSCKRKKDLSCEEFRLLIYAYSENVPDLTQEYRDKFERHLQSCPSCQIEYEEDQMLPELLKDWNPSASQRPVQKFKTTQEAWEDLKRRIEKHEQQQRQIRPERIRKACQVGIAVAASIVVMIGISWMVIGNQGSCNQIQKDDVASQVETATSENVFIEFVSPSGNRPAAFGELIKAVESPQEILLGGMHRVVLSPRTTATFAAEPVYIEMERRARYAIQLSKGEIYVEVVPGHPFTVKTDNALLNITGTKFNVTADSSETELTLLKGSVRFSNLSDTDKFVDVTAGYCSLIKGQSFPGKPIHTNALTATAWARDFIMRNTLAHIQPGPDEDFLESIRDSWMQTEPPNLDEIDYEQWLDDYRDWFKNQFPWIFDIQTVLKEEHNIEVDYIDLLMISGDIWQFNYPRPLGKSIPIFTPTAIERIAKHHKVNNQKLLQLLEPFNASFKPLIAKPQSATTESDMTIQLATNKPDETPAEAHQSAMKNWQSAIASAADNPNGLPTELLLFNLRAGTYLANTRTAAYLWVKDNPEKTEQLTADKNYCELFLPEELADRFAHATLNEPLQTYLADQVSDVSTISHGTRELFTTPKSSGCEDNIAKLVREIKNGLAEFMHGGLEK